MADMAFDAVILAGGRGASLGGVRTAAREVRGARLLDRARRAASGAGVRVVVGAVEVPDGVLLTREDPPGTGPSAGLLAGLDALAAPHAWVLVLACDLPDAPAAVRVLLDAARAAPPDADGLCLLDPTGRPQHLLALYRTDALRAAFARYGDPADRSVRGLVAPLRLVGVDAGAASVDDIDTWDAHARWDA